MQNTAPSTISHLSIHWIRSESYKAGYNDQVKIRSRLLLIPFILHIRMS